MIIKKFTSSKELVNLTEAWLIECSRKLEKKSLFLPAGRTPLEIYQAWSIDKPSVLSGFELLQVDDVIEGPRADMFREFFLNQLPNERVVFDKSRNEPAGLSLLGLGVNGHVAFHEPGLSEDFFSGEVELSPATCRQLDISDGTRGFTFGTGCFNLSYGVLLIVRGLEKQEAYTRFLDKDSDIPAVALQNSDNLTVLVESELS